MAWGAVLQRVGEEIKLCAHIEGQEACRRKWGRVMAALGN